MCPYKYTDKNTFEEYCELLDRPCDDEAILICPLLSE